MLEQNQQKNHNSCCQPSNRITEQLRLEGEFGDCLWLRAAESRVSLSPFSRTLSSQVSDISKNGDFMISLSNLL